MDLAPWETLESCILDPNQGGSLECHAVKGPSIEMVPHGLMSEVN